MTSSYELLYIIANKYTEAEIKGILEALDKKIAESPAKIIFSESMGKRKLAYPIRGFTHGYYILTHFDTDSAVIPVLNEKIKLSTEVLRHIITFRTKTDMAIIKNSMQVEFAPVDPREDISGGKEKPRRDNKPSHHQRPPQAPKEAMTPAKVTSAPFTTAAATPAEAPSLTPVIAPTTTETPVAKPKKAKTVKAKSKDLDTQLGAIMEDKDLKL
ncbi:MAG: small subunit ribosomal protein S6 [Parcubacteria group bacterium Gr01-1014_18]|nr:MAG: small subunit ribosomal protein S6 [Parcubacteria group bacterium Greene0416_36]TSC79688.1 MAG: small subunit ribosomal protein S6 [Parcubacteria group bacterium Gr01-1014_18]TSC97864.1 MAG: small subunit ribosomal protein S6 [Parcubacteria group bacterium Greene1014_20]TSD06488.1 MAG: small subunit ribosomal protein S6 [Parcubacteria group bacterium Greene0714_2]